MYFFLNKGKQELDLQGNLILTNNINLITSRIKSAAPSHVANAKYIKLQNAGFFKKLNATFYVIAYIWTKQKVLPTVPKLMAIKNPEPKVCEN